VPIEQVLVTLLVAIALVALFAALLARRRGRRLSRRVGAGPNGPERPPAAETAELARLATGAGIGLLRLDIERRIAFANEAAHGLLGRPADGLVGLSAMEGFLDHRVELLLDEAAAGGPARAGLAVAELAVAGDPARTLSIRAGQAAAGGTWLVLLDVSELRRLQRIRAEFVDNLSHELRTPLTTVRLLTERLAMELERTELPAPVRESIMRIDVETGHLVQMVNELLDLAKIEQGVAPLQLADTDLGRVVESTVGRLGPYAERQSVRLRAELPAAGADTSLRGDAARLEQMLINLVHNAVKFSAAGGEVVVRLAPAESELRLEVEDHGSGIPRAELDRIFERFYKVDRARVRGAGGTGLGLAIARHIAEGHGGRIWADSEEGAGSTFSVSLPRGSAVRSRG